MARSLRLAIPGVPLHVIQRGNNRGQCFRCPEDYERYLRYLADAALRYGCAIHAYVLMPNHVHLLLTPTAADATSRVMQQLGRRYVRDFNAAYGRTGTLWEGRFRSSLIDSERYFLICQRYIEQNPVRAGMVCDPGEYSWSSYRHHAAKTRDPMITEHECYLRIADTPVGRAEEYGRLCRTAVAGDDVERIRSSVNRGLPVGERLTEAERRAAARLVARLSRRSRARQASPTSQLPESTQETLL